MKALEKIIYKKINEERYSKGEILACKLENCFHYILEFISLYVIYSGRAVHVSAIILMIKNCNDKSQQSLQ